jgi:hypothetical protein
MITVGFRKSAIAVLAVFILATAASGQKKQLPSYISAKHRLVLQRWLKREPNLRVATDEDCGRCAGDFANQKRLSGADYHPYYTVGDFNGDGKTDFAVALIEVEERGEGRFTQKFVVAVFNAPFSRRMVEPAFEKDNLNLRDGGLFFGPPRSRPYRLFIGVFASDSGLTLEPRRRKYIAK